MSKPITFSEQLSKIYLNKPISGILGYVSKQNTEIKINVKKKSNKNRRK